MNIFSKQILPAFNYIKKHITLGDIDNRISGQSLSTELSVKVMEEISYKRRYNTYSSTLLFLFKLRKKLNKYMKYQRVAVFKEISLLRINENYRRLYQSFSFF